VNPHIREAITEDLQSVLRIYREAGLATRGDLDIAGAVATHSRIKTYPNYRVYVAETEGQIVGTFELLIMDNLANGGAPSGIVEDVAVLPSFQGRGVGKQMMDFALNLCRDHGCYKMTLSSNEIRSDAHAFYEALGFQRHGFSYRVELG